jgi:hypothetical protein
MHKVINPNFIQPSQFIKKIRPFIPISTNNYRKAFISSLTAPNFEKDDDKGTILIQKTMTYFKNLGIEDEEVILNCIKRELFLEELIKHEKDNTTEEFIKTEIAKEIDRIKEENEKLEKEIINQEKEAIIKDKEKFVTNLTTEKSQTEQSNAELIQRLEKLENEKKLESQYFSDREKWQNRKELQLLKNWDELPKRKWYLPLFVISVVMVLAIIMLLYHFFHLENYFSIIISLSLFLLGTIALSFFNRDKIIISFQYNVIPEKFRKVKMKEFEKVFLEKNPQPKRNDYTEYKSTNA